MAAATMSFDDFVQVCCHGKLDDVHAALDDNPTFINHHNPERLNRTALIEICISGKRHDVINVLIARGTDVNATDNTGQTALHHVMEISSAGTDLVKTLIDAGSDETIVDHDGKDIDRIARIIAHPDYKAAYNDAIAARNDNRAQQVVNDTQAAAQQQQETATRNVTQMRMAALRSIHAVGGKRFKL